VGDCWVQWLISAVILIGFSWIFIWLVSLVPSSSLIIFLQRFLGFFEKMTGLRSQDFFSPIGRVSFLFVHVVTLLVCVGWAVGRGSAPISGEVGRGRLDLLAALPVHRPTLIFIPAVVTAAGALLLALVLWAGIYVGLKTVTLEKPVSPGQFAPGVWNLAAMVFCLSGITCLVSSWVADRWRAIFLTIGVFLVSFILELVGRMWPAGGWLRYVSFLAAFQPQQLILYKQSGAWAALRPTVVLLGLGVACYVAAAVVFWRRDIPAAR
jgi:ABC-2 type transport system permease protein